MTEKALVEKQMKARDTLKTIRDTHELYSLFELLKYRLTYSGKILSLNIIIHYEWGNLEYLDYEIRSYKRSIQLKGKLLKTEKIIFKVVKFQPSRNNLKKNKLFWANMASVISGIEEDKYETQLLKYFDFIGWIKNKLEKQ